MLVISLEQRLHVLFAPSCPRRRVSTHKIAPYAALLVALVCSACNGKQETATHPAIGSTVQALALTPLEGGAPLTLRQAVPATSTAPVLLNLWATWCAPCTEELPSLEAAAAAGSYTVIAIATDRKKEGVEAYLKAHPMPHVQVMWDSGGQVAGTALQSKSLPETFVLEAQTLTVKDVKAGAYPWDSTEMLAQVHSVVE